MEITLKSIKKSLLTFFVVIFFVCSFFVFSKKAEAADINWSLQPGVTVSKTATLTGTAGELGTPSLLLDDDVNTSYGGLIGVVDFGGGFYNLVATETLPSNVRINRIEIDAVGTFGFGPPPIQCGGAVPFYELSVNSNGSWIQIMSGVVGAARSVYTSSVGWDNVSGVMVELSGGAFCNGPGVAISGARIFELRAWGPPPVPPAPTLTLTTNPMLIDPGDPKALNWTVNGAVSCLASASPASAEWTGVKSANDGNHFETVHPVGDTTFSLECFNAGGVSSGVKSVFVDTNCVSNFVYTCVPADCSGQPCGTVLNNDCLRTETNGCGVAPLFVGPATCRAHGESCSDQTACSACSSVNADSWKEVAP